MIPAMLGGNAAQCFAKAQPAIVASVADLERAIARLKELKEQRRRNSLETARIMYEIRLAYPDVPCSGAKGFKYNPQLVRAVEEAGYSAASIATYLWLHANPGKARRHGSHSVNLKRATYKRVLAVIEAGATIDDLKQAIQEELRVLG